MNIPHAIKNPLKKMAISTLSHLESHYFWQINYKILLYFIYTNHDHVVKITNNCNYSPHTLWAVARQCNLNRDKWVISLIGHGLLIARDSAIGTCIFNRHVHIQLLWNNPRPFVWPLIFGYRKTNILFRQILVLLVA